MSVAPLIDLAADDIQSSGTTVTTLISYRVNTSSNCTLTCTAHVAGKERTANVAGGYFLFAVFKWDGASTLAQVGVTQQLGLQEENADWDATIDFSGSDIRVRVAGATGQTVDWGGELKIVYGRANL